MNNDFKDSQQETIKYRAAREMGNKQDDPIIVPACSSEGHGMRKRDSRSMTSTHMHVRTPTKAREWIDQKA